MVCGSLEKERPGSSCVTGFSSPCMWIKWSLVCRFFTINHPNVQCSNSCKCSWGAITGAMTARAAVLWARGPCFTWWSAQHQHESGSFRTSKSFCLGLCTDLSMGSSTGDTRQVKVVWLELTLPLLVAPSDCPVWGNLGEVCSQLIWVMTWLLWPLLPGAKDVQSDFIIPAAKTRHFPPINVWSGIWELVWKSLCSPCEG